MGRIAALDIGRVRIGLAISDPQRIISSYLPEKTIERLKQALSAYSDIDTLLVGLPLLLSGADGEMAKEIKTLATLIETGLSIPVVLFDERLTTAEAEKTLKGHSVSRKKRTPLIDSMAASLLLRCYLHQIS